MNSTNKGNIFERRVYVALADALQNEQLCVSPKTAKIFSKKHYHSRQRNADIIVDVSIEAFFPGSIRPTLVWIFECKDYRGRIPIDDFEEFHAKLQQIGEDNTKGTFVTSGALQRSALNYARSVGIGVVRLLPNDQIDHVMEYSAMSGRISPMLNWNELELALTNPFYRGRDGFFATHDGRNYDDWLELLGHGLS
jgi:hypothetical protein